MFRLVIFLLAIYTRGLWVTAIDDDDTDPHWEAFKDKFNKTYENATEEAEARDNFEDNLLHVALHNIEDEHDYDKGLHEYSDMSVAEQIDMLCQLVVPANISNRNVRDFSTSERQQPSSVDWRTQNKVTRVKNQGGCGSCWAFSAAQALEGAAAMKWTYGLWELNEQQLVSCSRSYGNYGCNGGWPSNAYDYIKANGGLVEEYCYPYTAQDDSCKAGDDDKKNCFHFWVSSWESTARGDENALANAVAKVGPVSVCIYVSDNFMQYSNGIFYDNSYNGQGVNHAVLVVGYGSENGMDYWIIKNSWGESWGEKGYIRVRRNVNNHIQVATYGVYPVIN